MYLRLMLVFLIACATNINTVAQQVEPYSVPRTEHGHPDFQGVWQDGFVTLMERPPGVESLVASPDQAAALVTGILSQFPDNIDPDFGIQNLQNLAMVKGEYRTSLIVSPANGQMPFTEAGLELLSWAMMRDEQLFDHPEQRPLEERCLQSFGYPPMRTLPAAIPRLIIQNQDHVVIATEDAVGYRVIRLQGKPPADVMRTVEGYSRGYWEGDTLVVESSHFLATDPTRANLPRPVLISPDTKVVERFTRVSETELFYQFTVEDDELYTEPWSAEFSFTRLDANFYEYGCHEGNYSLPSILRGGQLQAAEQAAAATDAN